MLLPVYVPQLAPNEALVKTRLGGASSSQGTVIMSKRFNVPCQWKDITSICPGFEAFKDHFYERLDACQVSLNRKGLKFHKMFLVTVYLGLTEEQQRQWALEPVKAKSEQDHLFKDVDEAMRSFEDMTGFNSMIDKRSTAYL